MAGVFTRPELVLEPGLAQIGAMLLLMAATIAISFSIQARFADHHAIDGLLRLALAGIAMVVIFHPDRQVAAFACIPVGLFVGYWFLRRRNAPVVAEAGAG
jgi:ABC-type iron transport system FetAB permease component